MADAAHRSHVADRLLANTPAATAPGVSPNASAIAMLGSIMATRGLSAPADLVSPPGSGATTLWKINAAQTLVVAETIRGATIDDAFECGRIAATAALTAVYARAATPLFARLTCECPDAASESARTALVAGVTVALHDAGAALVDVQLVAAPSLRFEVLIVGTVRPDRLRTAVGAEAGDALILAGPIGAGIYAAAQAKDKAGDDDRQCLIRHATASRSVGAALGNVRNVHAIEEAGPEGLIAAVLGLARGAGLNATIESRQVPALPRALALAKAGCVASLSARNWNRDGASVRLDGSVMPEMRALLTDPQASGVLLVACKRESVGRVLKLCAADGRGPAAEIGSIGALPDPAAAETIRDRLMVN